MKTGTSPITSSMVLVVGLLMLAGILSNAHLAVAQAQGTCPLPAGGTGVSPPGVTAEQVESGAGSLMDFALISRGQFREQARQASTGGQALYLACLIREEGGPWRSGSTYLVTLTPDGRVFIHAKDMSLSGRQLNPLIYGAILQQAFGIDPARLLADPAYARAAFAEAGAGDGGAFSIPNVPGASGYASVYTSLSFRTPVVLLAGFDLNATHLAEEQIDYGNPAITAAEVVDRATLKAFVTEAGNYFVERLKTGDPTAVAKAAVAMRDPNGPWRHGSVYLYVLNLSSDTITFHAAFPDRFEFRPLVPTVRDAVTGEFVQTLVIEAAQSNPEEGGFVEYHFDDPTDDTDSADIPKVGYARIFVDQFPRADGTTARVEFIVGSGFYGSAPEVGPAGHNAVVESVLPQVMRAMTAGTVDAVSSRVERATSESAPAAGFSLGGASTFSDALLANGHALANDGFDVGRLLANSSFTLPLNAAGKGGGLFGNLTFWGSGDYRNISGGNSQSVDYDGSVTSGNLGIDTRLGADVLAGLALTRAQGSVDHTGSNVPKGELTTSLTSINPYMGWQMQSGMNLWATAGYGWGEVEIDDEAADTQASDLTQRMVAAGASGPLVSSDQLIGGGTTSLRLKGETAFTWANIEGSGPLESAKLSASRQRLMLEGVYVKKLASGATFTPSIEVGMRHDGGDGETGSSVETGGAVRYADAASGLTVEGRARTVLAHRDDYEEWGVSGLVQLDPGAAGLGFALSLQPAWGQAASGVRRLWDAGVTGLAADDQTARVKARIAYGIGTTWGGRGVLRPYTDVSLSGEGSRRLSVGGRFDIGSSVRMSLEGVHSRPAHGANSHSVFLRGALNW